MMRQRASLQMSACRRGIAPRRASGIAVVRSATDLTPTEECVEFAHAAARLRRTAFLLCDDWHAAEALSQSVLVKIFVSWRRMRRRDAACAYALARWSTHI
jgi:hypothetical protein